LDVTTLDVASDRFRMAVTSFAEIHVAMQKAVRTAFEAQSWDTAGVLAGRLKGAAGKFRRRIWSQLIEDGMVALLAGILASALTYGFTAR
jgi:hypothetical protein